MNGEKYINPGIETLVEIGFINRLVLAHGTEEKGARNGILNCLGCKLSEGEGVSVTDISECSGDDKTMVFTTLVKLEKTGLLVSDKVTNYSSPGYKKVYKVAETEGGLFLKQTIGVPPQCGLKK
jgi:hypothetical protein